MNQPSGSTGALITNSGVCGATRPSARTVRAASATAASAASFSALRALRRASS